MTPVSLAFAVLDASGRPGDLGIVLASRIVPQLLLLLAGGAVADRFPRRIVLLVANLGAGLTQGCVAVVLLTGHYSLPLVAGLALANGALEAFASPALRGIVPELVAPADLRRANSVLASTRNATLILGPTAAALIVAGFGGGWAIAIDALRFLAAAAFLARLNLPARPPAEQNHLLADIRDGWREFRSIRWVWSMAASFCALNLVNVGSWQVLGPALTKERSGEAAWGLVLGVRAGALGALPLFALGLGVPAPVLMGCAFIAALGFTVSGVTWETALQRHVPTHLLSRVSSYDDLLSYAAIPVGLLLVGPAASRWGAGHVALYCGVGYLAATLAPLAVRAVRDLPDAENLPDAQDRSARAS
jgi:MFS family permease